MQVGIITADGRQIGTVTMNLEGGDAAEPFVSDIENQSGRAGGSDTGKGFHHHGIGHSRPSHGPISHRHGPGHYQRGEDRRKSSGDLGDIPYSTSGNPFDRERFAKELEEKPWLKEKIKHISLGENQDPRANAAVMETMMNRAVVRGTSLEQQAKRHRSSGVDEGGYYAGYAPHYSTAKGEMADRNLSAALRGSNITNYATDNSSGALAARERASGSFRHHDTINGESFFSPGSAEPALRDRWQSLNKKAQEHERTKTAPEVMTAPYTYGKQSSVAKPYKVAERGVPPAIEKPYPHAPDPHKFDEGDPEEPPPPAPIPNRNPPPIPGDEREPGFGIPSDYDIG